MPVTSLAGSLLEVRSAAPPRATALVSTFRDPSDSADGDRDRGDLEMVKDLLVASQAERVPQHQASVTSQRGRGQTISAAARFLWKGASSQYNG